MLELLNQIDIEIFLFLNRLHASFFDFIMLWVSNKWIWIPLYIIIIYFVFKKDKKIGYLVIGCAILMVIFTDLISVNLFKEIFQRLRPCHEPDLIDKMHLAARNCGGQYGFISSHAANHFAIAVFFARYFRRRNFSTFIYIWAIVISYSRIYLGVHYPGDILGGIIIGSIIGYLFRKLYKYLFMEIYVINKRKI